MELLCKKSHFSISVKYRSALSLSDPNFEVSQNTECISTVETIIARICYSFGIMLAEYPRYKSLLNLVENPEEIANSLKILVNTAQDSTARLIKLYHLRSILWPGLKNLEEKVSLIPELNYFLSEALYL